MGLVFQQVLSETNSRACVTWPGSMSAAKTDNTYEFIAIRVQLIHRRQTDAFGR